MEARAKERTTSFLTGILGMCTVKMVKRDHTTSPTEIIPASKLKILPLDEREDFLVVKRIGKGLLVSGLRGYLEGLKKPERNGIPFVT